MRVAILIADGGDGSASLSWFRDIELANKVANDDDHCETFGMNEGGTTIIDVHDDFIPPGGWDDENFSLDGEEE